MQIIFQGISPDQERRADAVFRKAASLTGVVIVQDRDPVPENATRGRTVMNKYVVDWDQSNGQRTDWSPFHVACVIGMAGEFVKDPHNFEATISQDKGCITYCFRPPVPTAKPEDITP